MSELRIVLSLVALATVIVVGAMVLLGLGKDTAELLALAGTIAGGVLGYLTRGHVDEARKVIEAAPYSGEPPTDD